MKELLFASACLVLFVLYLQGEKIYLAAKINKIPLRICITGTRGKSTVTRLIAGILRENGQKVLAKTTGSRPVMILPDGSEKEIQRQGRPSINEGKYILKTAVRLKTQALVVEMMGIQPETMSVEAAKIFKPHILVITNVRLDHQEQMGKAKEDIAASFASAIPRKCSVFTPIKEFFPIYEEKARRVNASVWRVPDDFGTKDLENLGLETFYENDIQLAFSVAEELDVTRQIAISGIKKAQNDFGSLKVWTSKEGVLPESCCFVSAFAANEPESTAKILDYLKKKEVFKGKKRVALLSFRKDRGERTLQWIRAVEKGFLCDFDRVLLMGEHARAALKKIAPVSKEQIFLTRTSDSPSEITRKAVYNDQYSVVVGMGNMMGLGHKLIQYWDSIGDSCDL
ncbi:MAG: poly-gamma-glutamate synthase PgsB [Candidatus Aminicenantes bacterium]|nr:poly-gamma-glutamate synthase PgsB [Candidatus Aminicenantes bacterium]